MSLRGSPDIENFWHVYCPYFTDLVISCSATARDTKSNAKGGVVKSPKISWVLVFMSYPAIGAALDINLHKMLNIFGGGIGIDRRELWVCL